MNAVLEMEMETPFVRRDKKACKRQFHGNPRDADHNRDRGTRKGRCSRTNLIRAAVEEMDADFLDAAKDELEADLSVYDYDDAPPEDLRFKNAIEDWDDYDEFPVAA